MLCVDQGICEEIMGTSICGMQLETFTVFPFGTTVAFAFHYNRDGTAVTSL